MTTEMRSAGQAKRDGAKRADHRDLKKRSASKPTNPRNLIRGALGEKKSAQKLQQALEVSKHKAPISEFADLYFLANLSPQFSKAFPAGRVNSGPGALNAVIPLTPTTVEREIAWAATSLSFSSQRLREFIALRDAYFPALMAGEYEEAQGLLDRIDAKCGISTWSIENRIALLNESAGFESQKAYVTALTKKFKRTFISFFAANVGERNELRVSRKGFEARLKDRAKSWDIKDSYLAYIYFKLLGYVDYSPSNVADILAYEGACSAIDLYEALITILAGCFTRKLLNPLFVCDLLRQLEEVDDHRVEKLLALYSAGQQGSIPGIREFGAADIRYLDHFLRGDYSGALDELKKADLAGSDLITPLIIRGQLIALGIENQETISSLSDRIVELYGKYFAHDDQSTEAIDELEKISVNFRHLPFADALTSPIRTRSTGNATLTGFATLDSAIKSKHSYPQDIFLVSNRLAKESEIVEFQITKSLAWKYESYLADPNDRSDGLERISAEALRYARIVKKCADKDYDGALALLDGRTPSSLPFFDRDADFCRATTLHLSGDILEALKVSVRLLVEVPSRAKLLPLMAIIRGRGFRDLKSAKNTLALPIAFYIYVTETRDRSKEIALKVAWKQFLQSHALKKPSELIQIADQLDRRELIFFLREVCRAEVMELGDVFHSPTDLDQERIQICLILSRLDPENTKEYDDEIVELTRRIAIEDGVKLLDSSRVYVDAIGLEKWAQEELHELFLRYVDYASAGISDSVTNLEKKLREFLASGDRKAALSFLDNYDISSDSLLEELIEKTANAFLMLPRYGLDAFLSSRVRHGSLAIHFRGCLENKQLVTKIDSTTGEYEKNTHWLESIQFETPAQKEALSREFLQFSHSVDAMLDETVSRYAYVQSEAKPEGLIFLWPTAQAKQQMLRRWLLALKVQTVEAAPFPLLIQFMIENFFWPTVGVSLTRMQTYIKEDLATNLTGALQTLIDRATEIVPGAQASLLLNQISTAKTDIHHVAERISKWFNTPQKSDQDCQFNISTSLEIGLSSIRTARPHFDPIVTWNVLEAANVKLNHLTFGVLSDLMFLVFGNISKHSGVEENFGSFRSCPQVGISVMWREPDIVEISVLSEISKSKDIELIKQSVAKAKATIASCDYEALRHKNSGTGLVRMAMTLNYENAAEKTVDFGVTEDRRFFVTLAMPVSYLAPNSSVSK